MSKGLKALKEYRNQQQGVCVHADDYLDIIEEELKDKDELAQALTIVTCENGELLKYKKALEIIRRYALYVDWSWLFDCLINDATYKVYICGCNAADDINFADEEDYNLLKGVLL